MNATAVCQRLLALSQEQPVSGTVHSVFDHAVNLALGQNEGLIGLIAEEKALTPFAVTVRTLHPFTRAGVRAGMAAYLQNGWISIPEVQIDIDLASAKPVDLSVDSIELRFGAPAANTLREMIEGALRDTESDMSLAPFVTGGEGNTYTRFLAPRLEQLFAAVSLESADAAAQAAAQFAGCGMGLTPSSDDLLCGYFVTLHLLNRGSNREHARALIPRMAQAAAQRTNRISATFLLQSGGGLTNAALIDLFRSIFTFMDTAAAARAIDRVISIGSTSGADMLTGVVLALRQFQGGNEIW